MKKFQVRWLAILLVAAMSAGLAACSSDDSEDENGSGNFVLNKDLAGYWFSTFWVYESTHRIVNPSATSSYILSHSKELPDNFEDFPSQYAFWTDEYWEDVHPRFLHFIDDNTVEIGTCNLSAHQSENSMFGYGRALSNQADPLNVYTFEMIAAAELESHYGVGYNNYLMSIWASYTPRDNAKRYSYLRADNYITILDYGSEGMTIATINDGVLAIFDEEYRHKNR